MQACSAISRTGLHCHLFWKIQKDVNAGLFRQACIAIFFVNYEKGRQQRPFSAVGAEIKNPFASQKLRIFKKFFQKFFKIDLKLALRMQFY